MEPFRIEGIEVSQIGPFKELKLTFPTKKNEGSEIHILTGENGTGKSTILQTLASCVPSQYNRLHKKIWNKSDDTEYSIYVSDGSTVKYTYDYLFQLSKNGINSSWDYSYDVHTEQDSVSLRNMVNSINNQPIRFAFFAYSGYRRIYSSEIQIIKEFEDNPLEHAVDFNKASEYDNISKWLSVLLTKEALRKNINRDHVKRDESIILLQDIVSKIIGEKVQFEIIDEPLSVALNFSKSLLEFEQLPDGLLSIISWTGDLIMRLSRIKWLEEMPINERNFVLFLDEIEVHLHPAWQRKILPVLQQTFSNAQIFISTHSPFVIGSVDGAWVHQFEKKGNISTLKQKPFLTDDSYSYEYLLAEIFGIKDHFGLLIEKQLAQFRQLRDGLLSGETTDRTEFDKVVAELMTQKEEVVSIVGMELRRFNRLMNQPAV